MAKKSSPRIPAVLAFSRKLEVSDALMKSGSWGNIEKSDHWKQSVTLHEKRNRATHSQYGAKDADKRKPNLSWGDDAVLPHDADTLRVNFSLKIMGQLDQPTACDDPAFEKIIANAIEAYREQHQFIELATRYANNIVNGRFLWRNRCGAEIIEIYVKYGDRQPWKFNAYDYGLNAFSSPSDGTDFAELVKVVQRGLSGDRFEYLEVNAYSKMGKGQRVWPSQEMVLNIPKGEKAKILFKLNDCAGIHSEKIGNALRTIDNWYNEAEKLRPIAVEPYGSVTSRGEAHRMAKNDFYTLLDRWLKNPADVSEKQQHYIVATLIRGGVFGGKDD